ncbi:hypothetical protein LCX93_11445 [Sulfurimonas sp. SWIR-19]|uniref:hypothetical protein n=1 Tax=Sulfurimonas sp. SWIR-19 TaxID=2878390 RepID=UPI001CF4426A|nr:hypothetical protein [Sulfurimonas sp. SWIR-19]UCN00125.1 hypothetical protein LCX93_11445 [Sulfurimonas sp. SWIR-19]
MWGLVGWIGAAVAAATTVYNIYEEKGESTSESERFKKNKTEKNNKIFQEIQKYKNKQIKRFKDKYGIDIKFYGGRFSKGKLKEKIVINKNYKIDTISFLEQETEEILKLIKEIEVEKYESVN